MGELRLRVLDGGKSAEPKQVELGEPEPRDEAWETVRDAYSEEYREYLRRVYFAAMCWDERDWGKLLKPDPWWKRWLKWLGRMG